METNIIEKFNLPSYIKGKTFAEASKAIDKNFKDRNDTSSIKTKEALLERLAEAQEFIKMQQSMQTNSQEVPDMMNGQIPNGMEQYAQEGQQEGQQEGMEQQMPQEMQGQMPQQQPQPQEMQQMMQQQGMMARGGFQPKMFTGGFNGKTINQNQMFGGGWGGGSSSTASSISGKSGSGMNMISGLLGSMGGNKGNAKTGGAFGTGNSDAEYIMYGNKSKSEIGTQEKVKDMVGNFGPWFKLFRTIQKVGTSGGEKIAAKSKNEGMKTAGFAMSSLFSPSKTGVSISKNKHANMGERLAAWFLPGTGLTGSIAKKYANERKDKLDIKKATLANNQYKKSDFAQGGYLGVPSEGSDSNPQMMRNLDFSDYTNMMNNMGKSFSHGGGITNKYDGNSNETGLMDFINAKHKNRAEQIYEVPEEKKTFKEVAGNVYNKGKEILPKVMRYTPVLGNLLELKNLKRANNPRRDRLSSRYKQILADEKSMQNIVNNQNINRAILESSGGNTGAAMSNIRGANINKIEALGKSYLQAEGINRAENAAAQQYNVNVDRTNLGQSNLDEADAQANEGAYQTAKMQLKQAIYGDLGNIGKEGVQKAQVAKMFGYTYDGKYYYKDGKPFTEEEYKKAVATEIE